MNVGMHLYLLCALKKVLLQKHFVFASIPSCVALVVQGHSGWPARVEQAARS